MEGPTQTKLRRREMNEECITHLADKQGIDTLENVVSHSDAPRHAIQVDGSWVSVWHVILAAGI